MIRNYKKKSGIGYYQIFSSKVIKAVLFTIDNHERDISTVGYENKKIQTQDKWCQLSFMGVQSLLGTNHRLPLSHMAKSYIWIEEEINVLMSSLLDIRWIQIWVLTKISRSKWNYVWKLNLLQQPNHILVKYYWN